MEKLLTIKEAANVLSVSVKYLEEHREIPRIRLGVGLRPRIRFRPSRRVLLGSPQSLDQAELERLRVTPLGGFMLRQRGSSS